MRPIPFRPHRAGPVAVACALVFLAGCGNAQLVGTGPTPAPTPAVPRVLNQFTIPTANSQPKAMTTGADGFLYFTEFKGNKIGQMSTGGSFMEFKFPAQNAGPTGIATGPDGNIYATLATANRVSQFIPGLKQFKGFRIPTPNAGANAIIAGPESSDLYFTETTANKIGIVTTSGQITEYPVPTPNAGLQTLAVGSDNGVWFTEYNASKIGRIDPITKNIVEFPTLTRNAGPAQIVQGPDGAMWFTESKAGKMGRITTAGTVSEYSLSPAKDPIGLVLGSDTNFYFGSPANALFGRVSIATGFTSNTYAFPTANSGLGWLTLGPDGRIYGPETNVNKIAQIGYF